MKKTILCLLMVVSSVLTAFADNVVSVATNDGERGDEVKVSVSLTNTDDVVAAEFNIPLDEQLTYVDGSFCPVSSRVEGLQYTAAMVDNVLKVYFYSSSLSVMPKAEGELFSFTVKLGNVLGTYSIVPTVILSDADMNELTTTVSGTSLTILAPQIELGSTALAYGSVAIRSSYTKTLTIKNTGTSELDVTDIVFSSDVLSASSTEFSVAAGGSKSITITYSPVTRGAVTETAKIVSNAVNGNQTVTITASPYSVNILTIGNASGTSDSEVSVTLRLNNMEPIAGVQCSITLPSGLEYVDGSVTATNRCSSSFLASASVTNSVLTLYLFSKDGSLIDEGSGIIGSFRLLLNVKGGTYYLRPTDVILSNADMENMVSSTGYGTVSVSSPVISCSSTLDMGSSSLTETAEGLFSIKNSGKAPLTISKVTFYAEGFSVANNLPMTIPVGSTSTLKVNYKGSEAGDYSTQMNIYTNDPSNRIKVVTVSGSLYEPNTLQGRNILSADKKSCKLTLSLENYTEVVAVQLNIHGLTGMTTDNSKMKLTSRCQSLSSSVSKIGDGEYQVFIYSFGNTPITGNEGDIFTLTFSGDDVVNADNLTVTVDDIMISNSKGQDVASASSFTCLTNLFGDVNHDRNVDIVDAVAIINNCNGKSATDTFDETLADMTEDGTIDIADVEAIANACLGK